MNRITQSIFLIFIFASPVFGQESDTVFVPESDTVFVPAEPDSIRDFSGIDSAYSKYNSPEIYRLEDSIPGSSDTLVFEEPDFSHSPKKAIMYALVLPGLGQVYNRKYYKIPFVFAAFGGVGYAIVYNTDMYKQSIVAYTDLPDERNKFYLDTYRRYLEISYIGLIVVYALQVVDAYVDAYLHSWDVNDYLSLRVSPSLQPMMAPIGKTGQIYGLTCRFDLKRR